jgi:Tol biopolymer transport system component/DNA-binding winged helix-turn-helix (wHTH) protein
MIMQSLCFEFDDVLVDLPNARAWKAQKSLAIEPKAFRVLVYLLENRGRLVEKDELLSAVWADTFVTENALTRSIAQLRKALGDSKGQAKYIETAPTRGYRFIAPVSVREIAPNQGPGAASPVAAADASSAAHSRVMQFAVAALVTVAILVGVIWSVISKKPASAETFHLHRMQATSSQGMDIFPSFSPDGSTIAYSSDVNDKFEIYLKQLTRGSQVVQLTNDGQINLQPAWSPDGKTIAYYSSRRGGIWIVPALGGSPRQLTTFGSGPAWSPDGSQIVFQSAGIRDLSATAGVAIAASTLWTVSVHNGTARQISQPNYPAGAHNSPAWSPDGKSIAFTVSEFGSDAGLWTMHTDGSGVRRLAPGSGLYNPVYSRDGRSIYLGALRFSDFAVWKIPVSGLEATIWNRGEKIVSTFPSVPRYLAVSPDGHSLAYSDVRTLSELHSISLSAQTGESTDDWPVALTQDTRFRKVLPRFSPDGKRILFDVGTASFESGVWIMDADGKNSTQIAGGCASPAWLPGGEEFVCWDVSGDSPESTLVKYRLDTKRREVLRQLPATAPYLSVSPDGKSVVFMAAMDSKPNLWLASLAGGEPRQITFDPELAGFPTFSPDGKSIVYEQKRGDSANIMVIPSAGGTPRQLTAAPGQSWPHGWSPDGKKIAFAGFRNGIWNVWSVSAETGIEQKLTSYTQMNHYVRYPSWSPDGKKIVFEFGETTANVWVVALN